MKRIPISSLKDHMRLCSARGKFNPENKKDPRSRLGRMNVPYTVIASGENPEIYDIYILKRYYSPALKDVRES